VAVELVWPSGIRFQGFSFIELLVAMLVLGTAVFAHLGLHGQLLIDTRHTQRHLLALNIGLEWLQFLESQGGLSGLSRVAGAAPPVVATSCLNRYCTRSQLATYQAALAKCHSSRYADSSGCMKVRDKDALMPSQQTVDLSAGEVAATLGGLVVTITWQSEPTSRPSVALGRWQ
jgi:prepilin-type N-terminal cleavage/methylation domain-containing protein